MGACGGEGVYIILHHPMLSYVILYRFDFAIDAINLRFRRAVGPLYIHAKASGCVILPFVYSWTNMIPTPTRRQKQMLRWPWLQPWQGTGVLCHGTATW